MPGAWAVACLLLPFYFSFVTVVLPRGRDNPPALLGPGDGGRTHSHSPVAPGTWGRHRSVSRPVHTSHRPRRTREGPALGALSPGRPRGPGGGEGRWHERHLFRCRLCPFPRALQPAGSLGASPCSSGALARGASTRGSRSTDSGRRRAPARARSPPRPRHQLSPLRSQLPPSWHCHILSPVCAHEPPARAAGSSPRGQRFRERQRVPCPGRSLPPQLRGRLRPGRSPRPLAG